MKFSSLRVHDQNTTWNTRTTQQLSRHITREISGSILDVGCSIGISTIELALMFPKSHVYGVDYNESILQEHPKLFSSTGWTHSTIGKPIFFNSSSIPSNYSLICAKSPQLPFQENFFDLVCDMNNLYYSVWKMINEGNGSKGRIELENYFGEMIPYVKNDNGLYYISGNRKKRDERELPYEYCILEKKRGKLKIVEHTTNPTSQLELILESASQ